MSPPCIYHQYDSESGIIAYGNRVPARPIPAHRVQKSQTKPGRATRACNDVEFAIPNDGIAVARSRSTGARAGQNARLFRCAGILTFSVRSWISAFMRWSAMRDSAGPCLILPPYLDGAAGCVHPASRFINLDATYPVPRPNRANAAGLAQPHPVLLPRLLTVDAWISEESETVILTRCF